ncbi:MAG: hypothetical protein M3386_06505, partial [Actinomycetota bacterium]|nr:hypothetical protein [Actinomycetota bacterium]
LGGEPAVGETVTVEEVDADDAAAEQAAETPAETPDAVPGVAAEGQATVRGLLDRNRAGDHFVRFLAETSGWPHVKVHGIKPTGHVTGTPLDYSRYLRVRKQGSQYGGFAYAFPENGNVSFRLNFATDDDKNAVAPDAELTPKGHREYGVKITITDDSTLKQALDLARQAYDRT